MLRRRQTPDSTNSDSRPSEPARLASSWPTSKAARASHGPMGHQWRGHAILSPEAGDNRGKVGNHLKRRQGVKGSRAGCLFDESFGCMMTNGPRVSAGRMTATTERVPFLRACAFLPYLIDPWTGAVAFSTIAPPNFAPDGHMHAARATPR